MFFFGLYQIERKYLKLSCVNKVQPTLACYCFLASGAHNLGCCRTFSIMSNFFEKRSSIGQQDAATFQTPRTGWFFDNTSLGHPLQKCSVAPSQNSVFSQFKERILRAQQIDASKSCIDCQKKTKSPFLLFWTEFVTFAVESLFRD